ncbi:MAG: DUF6265 family protein [Betaproteobacteria bacterium]
MCRNLIEKLALAALMLIGTMSSAVQAATVDSTKAAPAIPAAAAVAKVDPAAPVQQLYIVHLTTGPGWNKDKAANEQAGFKEHSQNLSRMRAEGSLILGARYKDSAADKGMLVVRASNPEAVTAQFARDPMIRDKQFVLEVADFQVFYDGFVARPPKTSATADSPLNDLGWLAGCWSGRTGKIEFREHWMRETGGMMLGMARNVMDGKAVSHESMRIEVDASGTPAYVAKPSGQTEATFRAIKREANGIVFENLKHDFPQRIRYQFKPDGILHARIEGMKDGKEAGVDFLMRRAGCE